MRRDRITFAMMVGVPLMQLILFGYAINSDPKALPTAVVMGDHRPSRARSCTALQNSDYFRIVGPPVTEAEADQLLRLGEVQFVVTIPVDFSRDLVRGDRPTLLVEADATDPAATSNAVSALISLERHGARPRPQRPAGAARARRRRRSTCASSAATTRKASPSTTSCPA